MTCCNSSRVKFSKLNSVQFSGGTGRLNKTVAAELLCVNILVSMANVIAPVFKPKNLSECCTPSVVWILLSASGVAVYFSGLVCL